MADYKWWREALKGKFGEIHDSDPQLGFFRRRLSTAGAYEPVAIYEHGGKIIAMAGGKVADAEAIWAWVCPHPIPEAWYRDKMAGKPFPDEDQSVIESLEAKTAGMGHNSDNRSEDEIAKEEIDIALKGVAGYAEIKDDAEAAKAQGLRSRLLELSGSADKKREKLKAPHLEAGRKVDSTWQPLVKSAAAGADLIRKAVGDYLTRKDKAEKAAAAKAEEERLKAEAEAAKKAKKKNAPPPEPVPEPEPVPAQMPETTLRGGYGRGAAIVTKKVVTVVDQDKVYQYCRNHAEVVALMASLAQRAVTAGRVDVPGITIEEVKDIR